MLLAWSHLGRAVAQAEAAHEAKERAALQQEVRSTAARVAQLEGDVVAARKLSQEQAVQLQSKAVEAATASSELAGASAAARRLEGDLAEAGRREAGLRAELTQTSHRATQLTLELSVSGGPGRECGAPCVWHTSGG